MNTGVTCAPFRWKMRNVTIYWSHWMCSVSEPESFVLMTCVMHFGIFSMHWRKGSLDHPKFNFKQESRADLGFLSCILKKLCLFLMIDSIYLSTGNSHLCSVYWWFYQDELKVFFTTKRKIVCNEVTGAWGVKTGWIQRSCRRWWWRAWAVGPLPASKSQGRHTNCGTKYKPGSQSLWICSWSGQNCVWEVISTRWPQLPHLNNEDIRPYMGS